VEGEKREKKRPGTIAVSSEGAGGRGLAVYLAKNWEKKGFKQPDCRGRKGNS